MKKTISILCLGVMLNTLTYAATTTELPPAFFDTTKTIGHRGTFTDRYLPTKKKHPFLRSGNLFFGVYDGRQEDNAAYYCATEFKILNTKPPLTLPSVFFGTTSIQGKRPTMEDAHFPTEIESPVLKNGNLFFGVYDGHKGHNAADYCAQEFPKILNHAEVALTNNPDGTLYQSFLTIHESYKKSGAAVGIPKDGTTAVVALINEKSIITANTGDSRAVLGINNKAIRLSKDHKPNDPDEKKRVQSLGGTITEKGTCLFNILSVDLTKKVFTINPTPITIARIGGLSLSRALGDFECAPFVIPEPFINEHRLTGKEQCLILGCDGFWDVFDEQAAVSFVLMDIEIYKHQGITDPNYLAKKISEKLVSLAYNILKSKDNITVTLILFNHKAPTELEVLRAHEDAIREEITREQETNYDSIKQVEEYQRLELNCPSESDYSDEEN